MISIVIPTKDREEQLFKCLDAITEQTIDKSLFEIIIVNDGSVYSQNKIEEYKAKLPNLQYIELKQSGGPAKARNIGVKSSNGELIAFTDDDCIPNKDWLEKIQEYFQDPKNSNVIAVGGRVKPLISGKNVVSEYLAFIKHLDGPTISRADGKIVGMATANLTVRRQAFDAVGGFDERFPYAGAEDLNFVWKLSKVGELDFCQDIEVLHNHDIKFEDFCNKYRRYGGGQVLHSAIVRKQSKGISDFSFAYMPYCCEKIDIILRFGKIIKQSNAFLKNGTPGSVGLFKYMQYKFLALCQEYCFQMGAIDMRENLRHTHVVCLEYGPGLRERIMNQLKQIGRRFRKVIFKPTKRMIFKSTKMLIGDKAYNNLKKIFKRT